MNQSIFKRYEKKYLLTKDQIALLLPVIESHMQPDKYGKYTICNLYYDTEDYYLIRTSLDKPVYKEKLRLRSYGIPSGESVVFLELKKKYHGVVHKRRVELKLVEAIQFLSDKNFRSDFISDTTLAGRELQILKEIDYFLKFYNYPTPKVFLAYDRIAYFSEKDSGMRLTMDYNIRARSDNLDLGLDKGNTYILPTGSCIMEVKVTDALPSWFSSLLSELKIYPVSFSKYGTYYSRHIQANHNIC